MYATSPEFSRLLHQLVEGYKCASKILHNSFLKINCLLQNYYNYLKKNNFIEESQIPTKRRKEEKLLFEKGKTKYIIKDIFLHILA